MYHNFVISISFDYYMITCNKILYKKQATYTLMVEILMRLNLVKFRDTG